MKGGGAAARRRQAGIEVGHFTFTCSCCLTRGKDALAVAIVAEDGLIQLCTVCMGWATGLLVAHANKEAADGRAAGGGLGQPGPDQGAGAGLVDVVSGPSD